MARSIASSLAVTLLAGLVQSAGPEEHWAFRPPQWPEVPRPQVAWGEGAVDRFILAGLEQAGLTPSPQADRRTLIRRVYFDLLGLPPTAGEVRAFVSDPAVDAYERLIDRLLASPQYGERWGRYWLDLARYSDTKGYVYGGREERLFVHSHVYRDWVIGAFNRDLPYDRFLLEQIAADQLPDGQPQSLAAMGFLTLGRRFLGVIPDIIDDRIDVLTRATQGLTVACARCHDHKYDPIPTADYYSLYGVLAATTEKIVPLDTTPQPMEGYAAYEKELKARQAKLQDRFAAKKQELLDRLRARAGDYLAAVPEAEKLPHDGFYELRSPEDLNPTVVRQWQAYLFRRSKQFDPIFEPWHALAKLKPAELAAQSSQVLAQLLADTGKPLNSYVAAALAGAMPATMKELAGIYGKLLVETDELWRQSLQADASLNALAEPDRETLRLVLYGADSPTSLPAGTINEIEWFFDEPTRVELSTLQAEIERWIIASPAAPPHAVVFQDRPNPPVQRIYLRGNHTMPGPEVPRQYLSLIEGPARTPITSGSGRLQIAQTIASAANPLTARVMVNRVWAHHFGQGLVTTPSDFGVRTDAPSHPELLDYLAMWFTHNGWSIKKLHRLLMLSATYRQTSEDRSECYTTDPDNRLLWRMNPRRLDLESMRDAMLTHSGELDAAMGGRPVDLFGRDSPRRTVYGMVDRQFLPGVYRVFDFAGPDLHCPQRPVTTVPQQALFLANSAFSLQRARALAARPDVAGIADPAQRVQRLYEIVFQRPATPQQISAARQFIAAVESDPAPPAPSRTYERTAWRYGYGEFDEETRKLKSFIDLPHFAGGAWQGGPSWPDPALGWVRLTADGGHAGNDQAHAAIRRWIAPVDGSVRIAGTLKHEYVPGDGIRARLVSSRHGLIAQWELHNQSAQTVVDPVEVKAGDTLDFVVDLRKDLNSDMFTWVPVIQTTTGDAAGRWSAVEEFAGPSPPPPLSAWEQYAQALLMSNEFLFVD